MMLQQEAPLRPGLPDGIRRWQHCLWSEEAQSNISLWMRPFLPISFLAQACLEPQGGQRRAGCGEPPAVELVVVAMRRDGTAAAQCL